MKCINKINIKCEKNSSKKNYLVVCYIRKWKDRKLKDNKNNLMNLFLFFLFLFYTKVQWLYDKKQRLITFTLKNTGIR